MDRKRVAAKLKARMESSSDFQTAGAAAPMKDHSDSKENRSETRTEHHHGRAPSRSRSGSRSRGLRRSSRTCSSRDQQLDGDDHHRHHEDGARSGADHQHHRRGGDRSRSRGRGDSRRRRRSRSQGRRRSRSLDRYGGESSRRHADRSRSRSQRRVKRRSVSLDRLDEPQKRTSTGDRRSASWNGERTSEYRERDHRDWDDRHRRQPSRSRDRSSGRQPQRRRDRRGGRRRRGRRQDHQQQQQSNDPEQQVAENGNLPEAPNNQRHNSRHGGGERQPRRRSKISIPENWEDVAKMGDLIRDSRFLPMRCPLDDKFTHLYESPNHAWSPKLFVQEQESKGHNVRMVIDLTNTFKYYDGSAEFEGTSIEYVKLKIEGFNAPPREDEVAKFMTIVDAFLEKEPEGSIAVHCTHGLNRTGYLIVNYLVKKLGCTVKHALESFSLARPPGLIKHMYVEALYRSLGEGEELELPVLPDWAADKYSKRR